MKQSCEVLIEGVLVNGFIVQTDDLIYLHTIFEDEDSRNTTDAVGTRSFRISVAIHFIEFNLTCEGRGKFVKLRHKSFARTTPRSPKIDQHYIFAHCRIKVGIHQCFHPRFLFFENVKWASYVSL